MRHPRICSASLFFALLFFAVPGLVVCLTPQAQAAIDVDGLLGDWDIGLTGGTGSDIHLIYGDPDDDWEPYGHTYSPTNGPLGGGSGWRGTATLDIGGQARSVQFHLEDTNDTSNNYQVGPLYGGQNFDGEFLGVALHDNNAGIPQLWIAISSGQRPDNGFSTFEPGDIRIETNDGSVTRTYGLEVGGGAGDSTETSGHFVDGGKGTTYNLKSSGHVESVSVLDGQQVGSLWETASSLQWRSGISGASEYPDVQLVGGTRVGGTYLADYYFNYASSLGEHAWIEAAIDLSQLAGDPVFVGWAPSCGNDNLYLSVELKSPPIPEPASIVVWTLLALAVGGGVLGRKNRRS